MYYDFHVPDGPGLTNDVAKRADSEHSIETAAYTELHQSSVEGSAVPTYYGSWTLIGLHQVDSELVNREVRLILIEYLPGVCMLDLNPDDLSEAERLNIMRKVIEADYDVRYAGVRHGDLSSRNIILSSTLTLSDPDLRVTSSTLEARLSSASSGANLSCQSTTILCSNGLRLAYGEPGVGCQCKMRKDIMDVEHIRKWVRWEVCQDREGSRRRVRKTEATRSRSDLNVLEPRKTFDSVIKLSQPPNRYGYYWKSCHAPKFTTPSFTVAWIYTMRYLLPNSYYIYP
jgi:hypothetical protein